MSRHKPNYNGEKIFREVNKRGYFLKLILNYHRKSLFKEDAKLYLPIVYLYHSLYLSMIITIDGKILAVTYKNHQTAKRNNRTLQNVQVRGNERSEVRYRTWKYMTNHTSH